MKNQESLASSDTDLRLTTIDHVFCITSSGYAASDSPLHRPHHLLAPETMRPCSLCWQFLQRPSFPCCIRLISMILTAFYVNQEHFAEVQRLEKALQEQHLRSEAAEVEYTASDSRQQQQILQLTQELQDQKELQTSQAEMTQKEAEKLQNSVVQHTEENKKLQQQNDELEAEMDGLRQVLWCNGLI